MIAIALEKKRILHAVVRLVKQKICAMTSKVFVSGIKIWGTAPKDVQRINVATVFTRMIALMLDVTLGLLQVDVLKLLLPQL